MLTFSIEAKDYGAVLATKSPLKENRASLLANMKTLTATPLSSLSDRRTFCRNRLVDRFDETSVGDTSRNGENYRG